VSLLREGRSVVVLPEGTRSRDGQLGDFHAGAFRLAAAAGVPVIPVGLVGTAALLPVHGRPHRNAVEVRVGGPLAAAEPAPARTAVADLVSTPAHPADSRIGAMVRRLAMSPAGLVAVMLWALAEAVSWPLVPEVLIGVFLVARIPWRRVVVLVAGATIGSVVGCALTYGLAVAGHPPPAPLTTVRMHETAASELAVEGPSGVHHQAWSGIPVKVYAAAAGDQGVPVAPFLADVARTRALRIATVALFVGSLTQMLPRRMFVPGLAMALTFFGIGLERVIASWN
jgi:membrane protein YqaA with SNARE-associated domain